EMLDWHGSGMGVMEMSHRGKEFISIYEQAEADLRELLAVPANFKILFMQGGGLAENAIVPLNLSRAATVDFVVTGGWSQKSQKEALKYASESRIAASGQESGFTTLPAPSTWQLSKGASYVHLCSNETIHGVEFHELPDLQSLGSDAPLVIDFSSHVASRGVRGMMLEEGQSVIAMLVAEDETQSVLTATENGYGKRTSIVEYTRHGRGTKGMIAIQQSERNGKVVAATLVHADDEIMLITDTGVLVRTRVSEIRELGRATQGVTLISLDEGAKLSGLQRIVENDANAADLDAADAPPPADA
ncbi:MAG: aminotransferase class V-fold PLP-dependent enzyme, partial [Acidovorax sp.]|nr:aminotransferase class V-fold PLP-dependent enzyme [Acidovorax sp.]